MKKFIHIFCLLILSYCLNAAVFSKDQSYSVRIAILKDTESFITSIRGSYKIIDLNTNEVIDQGRRLSSSKVILRNKDIYIGRDNLRTDRIRIELKKDLALLNKKKLKRYRGWIDIVRKKNNKFLVVNRVDLEDYVRGVLYHEVSHRWPIEAIKAQAVATRSYAMYQMKMNKDQPYDVTSDIYSQVYGGKNAERFRTNIAVKRTSKLIMMHHNQVLPAYFHSNSGGHTENVQELWKHKLTPLQGVNDQYSIDAPNYHWKKNFKSSDIQKILNKQGLKIGLIKDIKVINRNGSGRIKNLKITDRQGNVIILTGKKFRSLIGSNIVRSNNFEIIMKGYYFDLVGKGWGHGVGMSQWGAYNMARKKIKYQKILQFYYPGIKLAKY